MDFITRSLPNGWVFDRLGELAEINPRRFDPAPDQDELVSFVPMAAVEAATGRLDPSVTRPWSEVMRGYTTFQDNDVLFAKITPCMENGKFAVARGLCGGRAAGSTEFHVLRPTPAIEPTYLLMFLLQESFRSQAKARMSGAVGQQRVPKDFLEESMIPVPPIAEQQRIVAAIEEQFTRLDAAVAGLKRTQANLRRYRAAVLAAACSGRLVPTEAELAAREGREYESADKLLEHILRQRQERWEADQFARLKAKGTTSKSNARKSKYREPVEPDAIGAWDVPEGWCIASVDQLTSHITSGSRDWSKYYGRGSGTFIMAQNVRPGLLDLDFRQAVDPPPNDRDRLRSQVEQGDLLVTIVGANTGDVCCVPRNLPEHYVCQSVALMRPVDQAISDYMNLYLNSQEHGKRQYRAYIYGQGRPHLSFDQLRMTAIALPSIAEQQRIVAEVDRRLSVIEELERTTDHALLRAERLKQSILQRAFEGKLVPQDRTDEPAEVLLDRIRAERVATSSNGRQRKPRARRSTQQSLFDLERVGETE